MEDNVFLQMMRNALQKRRDENDKLQVDSEVRLQMEIERKGKIAKNIELKSVTMIRSDKSEKYRRSDSFAYKWGWEVVFWDKNYEFEYKIRVEPKDGGFLCEIDMEQVIWDEKESLIEELYLRELVKAGVLDCHPANCACG